MNPRLESPRGPLAAALLVAVLRTAPGAAAAPPTPTAPAAKAAAPEKAPSVEEILERYVTARGGIEKLRSLQTLREEGRIHAGPGRDGLVSREVKRPGKIRIEFTVQGVTEVFASDGQRGWAISPRFDAKGPQLLPADEVADARENADPEGPLVDWKSKGNKVELAAREAVDGKDAWKLKVTLKSGGILVAWIDVDSSFLVRTEADRKLRGKPVRIERTFADYRMTGGILFPYRVEIRTSGRPEVFRVLVDKVEVNPALGDSRFTPPA